MAKLRKSKKLKVQCVAFGRYESTGEPACEAFTVKCTKTEYDNGDHYGKVRDHVTSRSKYENQYESSDIVIFDEKDAGALIPVSFDFDTQEDI